MSRHKLVKGLDLDEELNDYDGAEYDPYEDEEAAAELAPEDKEHLRRGTVDVRNTLGLDFPATDKEIQDSLYYYYYDVEKTVQYLLNQKTPKSKSKSKPKPKPKDVNAKSTPIPSASSGEFFDLLEFYDQGASLGGECNTPASILSFLPRMAPFVGISQCSAPFSVEDFFRDSPWLNVPEHRRGAILIEPLHPPGRLLGGSGNDQDAPPRSKLAALAAARKKKENVSTASKETNSSVALLDKLGTKLRTTKIDGQSTQNHAGQPETISKPSSLPSKKYPTKKRQAPEPSEVRSVDYKRTQPILERQVAEDLPIVAPPPTARPSTFARTLFGPSAASLPPSIASTQTSILYPAYTKTDTKNDPFAGPSPDDVVTKAQNSKGSKNTKNPSQIIKANDATAADVATREVANLTIGDAPRIKSKNLNVVQEYEQSKPKNAANFVVIGHVDAGKSTLMGRLLHDLKLVDQRTIDKYHREASKIGKSSFALAWVLDQGTEERARGVTIDIATNQFSTSTTDFTILDAPGHRDFIPNMIAGASQADFALLVIDAGTGNFESGLKGQTKEHALLVRSMGVQRIVVAVNKLDSIDWSEDRFHEIEQQISAFLTTAGFLAKNISFVPCSGLTGDNIVHSATAVAASWTTGRPNLIEALEYSQPITRALEKPLRLTIDDIFRGGVQNPLSISGRLDAGTVQVGDSILVMPANQTATIKALDVNHHHNTNNSSSNNNYSTTTTEWAVAGQNCILHLTDIDPKYLKPGDVVCNPSTPIPCITTFTVKLLAFDHIMPMHCEVHKGRLHAPGRITTLVAVLDKASGLAINNHGQGNGNGEGEGKGNGKGKGKRPRLVKPGSVARVVVEVEGEPVPLEQGGRVILRAGGETVGAGLVE